MNNKKNLNILNLDQNKNVGFWFRIWVLIFDLLFSLSLPIGLSTLIIKNNNNQIQIDQVGYYLWLLMTIFWIFIYWILIPYISKGYTLSKWIFRIKITPNKSDEDISKIKWFYLVIKNQVFFSLSWITMLILSMIFISPDLAIKISLSTTNDIKLSIPEQALVSIPSTFSTIIIFINFFIFISVAINKNKLSISERYSGTKLVYLNKTILKRNLEISTTLEPIPYKKNNIIFLTQTEKEGKYE